ncbi:MAG: SseB family protein, partial [Butyricicoccus sp.]
MENKFLDGNERIVQAIAAANAEESMENFRAVVDAIQDRMIADGHFLLPVVHPDGNEEQFLVRTLRSEKGENYMVAFTSEAEVTKGAPTGILSYFIDSVLEIALQMEGVA